MTNPENKKCGQSCGCDKALSEKDLAQDANQNPPQEESEKKLQPDPTRFGDWEVNGRAIDF